jgi:outer membrane lipoprotein LolB
MIKYFNKVKHYLSTLHGLRILFGLALGLLLSACAKTPALPPAAPHALTVIERNQVITSLKYWRASGEAALTTPRSSENFGFRWEQSPQLQTLSIYDPLGRTVARISVDAQGAKLATITGEHRQAASLATLLNAVLHVDLPAKELPDWMLALHGKHSTVQVNAAGLPKIMVSGPWQIHYLQYAPVGGLTMPKLLQAKGPDGITLRMAITQWHMGNPQKP